MRIDIHANELKRLVKLVSPVVSSRNEKFANVEVGLKDGAFFLHAVNEKGCDVTASTRLMAATMADNETVLVDGDTLKRVSGSVSGNVTVIADDKVMTIRSSNGRTKIPLINGNLPGESAPVGDTVAVNAVALSDAIDNVLYAVARDETRLVLTGVLFRISGGKCEMVALDGFQMAMERIDAGDTDLPDMVIPADVLKIVSSGLEDGDVEIATDGKRVSLKTDGMTVSATLLSGQFIDWQRVVPTTYSTMAKANTETLIGLLKGADAAENKSGLIRLNFTQDGVKVSCNSESADYEGEMLCDVTGNDLTIAFNKGYLMNALNTMPGGDVELRLNSSVQPIVVVTPENREKGFRLALPVRVQE